MSSQAFSGRTTAVARRIAVCADDYGQHAAIDAAVLQLARAGRVTAISCQVGGAAWRADAPALRTLDPHRIDIGLHLDFTSAPLRPRSRQPLPQLIGRAFARWLDPAAVRAEIDAQLDAFEQAMGRAPAHVDGHQHVHQLPVIRPCLLAALAARRYPVRPWLRSTRPALRSAPAELAKSQVIDALGGAALRRDAAAQGHATNARLLGVYALRGDAPSYAERVYHWLESAEDGDLLMVHPATADAVLDPTGPAHAAARQAEYLVLASPRFDAWLAEMGVRVTRLSDTVRAAPMTALKGSGAPA
jgi:predicted glycoside hydrolase/deacetylase ChbG (UPF0249 family)